MNHPDRSKTKRDADPTVAEIRAARVQAGLTQAEAARRIRSTSRAWQCWESEGGENCRMHPALFELFLVKTGQTDVLGRGCANDGSDCNELAQSKESAACAPEMAAQNAQEVADGLASGVLEDFVCPPAVRGDEAAEQYVTRYGLRRIAGYRVAEIAAAMARGLSRLGDRARRENSRTDANDGREKITR